MNLLAESGRMIKAKINALESKIRNKDDLNNILRQYWRKIMKL